MKRLPSHITRRFLLFPRRIYVDSGTFEPAKRWRWLCVAYHSRYMGFSYWSEWPV